MHLDCSSVCRGRCGYINGAPKQAVSTSDGADCLCVFGGDAQCWVLARIQCALTLPDDLPAPAGKAAKGPGGTATVGGSSKQVKGAQSETSEVAEPDDAVEFDAKTLRANTAILNTEREIHIEGGAGPGAQGEHGQRGQQGMPCSWCSACTRPSSSSRQSRPKSYYHRSLRARCVQGSSRSPWKTLAWRMKPLRTGCSNTQAAGE